MNQSEFWMNFRLGEEIHISGAFIYNGLRRFYELRSLDFADELFEFLYDLSVGIERLLKTAVVLYEYAEITDQEAFEKSLCTHNHGNLVARIRKYSDLKIGAVHNDFLSILSTFYKSQRYDRFMLNSIYEGKKESTAIRALFIKYLQVEFPDQDLMFGAGNEDQYREFIRRTVLKIAREVYGAIKDRARDLNLYTYELRYGSKAENVLLNAVEFSSEDVLWKELLIFFMNSNADTSYLQFLKSISPLEFDPAMVSEYLECFKSGTSKAPLLDELESLYDDLDRDERYERLGLMEVIGAPHVFMDDDVDNSESRA